MGWVEDLRGKTVGVDTSPFIFFIEEHPSYAPVVDPFFEAVSRGEIQLVTSTIALLEVLVHPIRHDDEHLAQRYNDILLSSPHISTIAVTPKTSQLAAELHHIVEVYRHRRVVRSLLHLRFALPRTSPHYLLVLLLRYFMDTQPKRLRDSDAVLVLARATPLFGVGRSH